MTEFYQQNIHILLPLFIFFLKTCEICLNSIRVISIAKGYQKLAVIIAIFECTIWLTALSTVFTNLDNLLNILSYVTGMAFGNYLGMQIERKLALGDILIRIITQKDASQLLHSLRGDGFRVTEVPAESNHGNVSVLFAPIKRNHQVDFFKRVKEFNPKAFYTVEEIKQASIKIGKESLLEEPVKAIKSANKAS